MTPGGNKGPKALILTPTRELTLQVHQELCELKGKKPLSIVAIYGGASIEKQIQQLKRCPEIVVGTPGRVMDHMRGKRLSVAEIEYLILDEADEMLNGGFIEDLEWILEKANPKRRTVLFSATMPDQIRRISERYMKNTTTINVKKETLATTLTTQWAVNVKESQKLDAVCRIMDAEPGFYGLIFCRTKRNVDAITEKLVARGYSAEAMHGDCSQGQRERVLTKFRQKVCSILVVTDVASRGLDISGLSHVVNFALPNDAESYVHRIGRTGRAGQKGKAISLVTPAEQRKISQIQKVAKTEILPMDIPTNETIMAIKKERIMELISSKISGKIDQTAKILATQLLKKESPEDLVAALIELKFKIELSPPPMELTPFKEDTGRRGGGGGGSRGSYKGGGGRGNYKGGGGRDRRDGGGSRSFGDKKRSGGFKRKK